MWFPVACKERVGLQMRLRGRKCVGVWVSVFRHACGCGRECASIRAVMCVTGWEQVLFVLCSFLAINSSRVADFIVM